jgi:hypothetical protein
MHISDLLRTCNFPVRFGIYLHRSEKEMDAACREMWDLVQNLRRIENMIDACEVMFHNVSFQGPRHQIVEIRCGLASHFESLCSHSANLIMSRSSKAKGCCETLQMFSTCLTGTIDQKLINTAKNISIDNMCKTICSVYERESIYGIFRFQPKEWMLFFTENQQYVAYDTLSDATIQEMLKFLRMMGSDWEKSLLPFEDVLPNFHLETIRSGMKCLQVHELPKTPIVKVTSVRYIVSEEERMPEADYSPILTRIYQFAHDYIVYLRFIWWMAKTGGF